MGWMGRALRRAMPNVRACFDLCKAELRGTIGAERPAGVGALHTDEERAEKERCAFDCSVRPLWASHLVPSACAAR
jgi:hypothetical protein